MKRTPLKRRAKKHKNLTPEVIEAVNIRADATVGWGRCERCGGLPDWRGLCYAEPIKGMGGTTRVFEVYEVQRCCYRCHVSGDHGIVEVESAPEFGKVLNESTAQNQRGVVYRGV